MQTKFEDTFSNYVPREREDIERELQRAELFYYQNNCSSQEESLSFPTFIAFEEDAIGDISEIDWAAPIWEGAQVLITIRLHSENQACGVYFGDFQREIVSYYPMKEHTLHGDLSVEIFIPSKGIIVSKDSLVGVEIQSDASYYLLLLRNKSNETWNGYNRLVRY